MTRPLRLGILSYVNCLPMTLALERRYLGGEVIELVQGSPADLNRAMADGELDMSVVSTVEFLTRRDRYRRSVARSLWCDGKVDSVTLFSPLSREELQAGQPLIAVTPESATSVALLELLLPGAILRPFADLEELRSGLLENGEFSAVLLIGDGALQPPDWCAGLHSYDLGSWWKEQTGFPMTYAVWVARRDLDFDSLQILEEILDQSLEYGLAHPEEVLAEALSRCPVDPERLSLYFRNLQYRTTDRSAEGLVEFGGRLALNRFLTKPPVKRPLTAH